MADDTQETGDALRLLTERLPSLAERMAALLAEEASARAEVAEFLQRAEERQAEAADLLSRVEAVQIDLRTQAATEAERLERWTDPSPALSDPALAFEEQAAAVLTPLSRAQSRHVAALRDSWNGVRETKLHDRGLRVGAMRAALDQGGTGLVQGWDTAGRGAQALRELVDTSRETIGHELEKLVADLGTQQTATARDVESMRRDLEGYDAAFQARLTRVREVVRQDAERLLDDTRDRVADLRDAIDKAVEKVTEALRALDEYTADSCHEALRARESLVPLFERLEEQIPPLKRALDHVREAAHLVGIAF